MQRKATLAFRWRHRAESRPSTKWPAELAAGRLAKAPPCLAETEVARSAYVHSCQPKI
jgi:hypothetical protein